MRFTILLLALAFALPVFSQDEPGFVEFEASLPTDTSRKYKVTILKAESPEQLEDILEHYSEEFADVKNIGISTTFHSEKTLKKYNFPKNEGAESARDLVPKYFKGREVVHEELSGRILSDLRNHRKPSSKNKNPFVEREVSKLTENFSENYRVYMTIFRSGQGGTMSFVAMNFHGNGVLASGIYALTLLIQTGMIQWNYEPFTKFFTTNFYTGKWRNKMLAKYPILRKMGLKDAEEIGRHSKVGHLYSKWGAIEALIVGNLYLTLNIISEANLGIYYKDFASTMIEGSGAVAKTVGTQGIFESSIVKLLGEKIKQSERVYSKLILERLPMLEGRFESSSLENYLLLEKKLKAELFLLEISEDASNAEINESKAALKDLQKNIKEVQKNYSRKQIKNIKRKVNNTLWEKGYSKANRLKNSYYIMIKLKSLLDGLAMAASAVWSVSIVFTMMEMHTLSYMTFGSLAVAGLINYGHAYINKNAKGFKNSISNLKKNLKGHCGSKLH